MLRSMSSTTAPQEICPRVQSRRQSPNLRARNGPGRSLPNFPCRLRCPRRSRVSCRPGSRDSEPSVAQTPVLVSRCSTLLGSSAASPWAADPRCCRKPSSQWIDHPGWPGEPFCMCTSQPGRSYTRIACLAICMARSLLFCALLWFDPRPRTITGPGSSSR